MINPLVSACVVTYNQENTISQTIDAILNQNINFPIEIIIGEDCSTDSTRNICLSYKKIYPDIITLILHEQNQGLLKNYKSVMEACKGKYIAQCAGDDYWHNPDKLKLQVDFLENHLDYGLVHSRVDILAVKTNKIVKFKCFNIPSEELVFDSLLENGNHLYAATVMFRRSLLVHVDYDEFMKQGFLMEDFPQWLEFSRHTKFHFMNIVTATYRISQNSISNTKDYAKNKLFINNVDSIHHYYYAKYPNHVDYNRMNINLNLIRVNFAILYNNKKDINSYFKYIDYLPSLTLKQKIKKILFKNKLFGIYRFLMRGTH